MSVMMLDVRAYEDVAKKLKTYQFHKTCDIDYCYAGSMADEMADNFVKALCELNELSYCAKYADNHDDITFKGLHNFIQNSNRDVINTYQMLKHLKCIQHQIEPDTVDFHDTFELPHDYTLTLKKLNEIIDEISCNIIGEIPEYKAAGWGDTVYPSEKYMVMNVDTLECYITVKNGPVDLMNYLNEFEEGGYSVCNSALVDGYNPYATEIDWPVRQLDDDYDFGVMEQFPNFDASGSPEGMKDLYYGKGALLVKLGGYIYNVTSKPEIYFEDSEVLSE